MPFGALASRFTPSFPRKRESSRDRHRLQATKALDARFRGHDAMSNFPLTERYWRGLQRWLGRRLDRWPCKCAVL